MDIHTNHTTKRDDVPQTQITTLLFFCARTSWLVSHSAHSHVPDDTLRTDTLKTARAYHLRVKLYSNLEEP
jgi:hypothetical protein